MANLNNLKMIRIGAVVAMVLACVLLSGCQKTIHAQFVGDHRFLDIIYEAYKFFVGAIIFFGLAIWFYRTDFRGGNLGAAKVAAGAGAIFVLLGFGFGYKWTGEPCAIPEPGQLNDCPSYREHNAYYGSDN